MAGNPGRGAHRLIYQARTYFESRELIANHLGIVDTSRLVFTSMHSVYCSGLMAYAR
ncbi:MAG: hypothetical protein IPP97_14050 [Candidatus Obscuribacter sp.]|nr:hypothetical protein [Candidatus Obscuribacter sp.]